MTEKKATKDKPKFDEPGECPYCGRNVGEDSFDMGEIYIDTDTGFVTLKKDCDCGKKLELFYNYDRTEVRED
jgi:hypothetical protein